MVEANINEAFGGLIADLSSVGAGIVGTTRSYQQINDENSYGNNERLKG